MWMLIGNRLLLEKEHDERRRGNIVIPETAYDSARYIIAAVGTGDEVRRFRVGQRVVCVRPLRDVDEVVLDGKTYYLADYRDILAVEVEDEGSRVA